MDFYFGQKSTNGISVIMRDSAYYISVPEYLLKSINSFKFSNWIRELKGTLNDNGEVVTSLSLKPSDIYYSYYHFIE